MRVNFLTRQGAVLKSGPAVKFLLSGGRCAIYFGGRYSLIGPSNVIVRILEFTGVDGDFFFYLPRPSECGQSGGIDGYANQ